MCYFNFEPFGSRHRDHLFANLTAIVANMFRSADADPFNPEDFIPKYTSQPEVEPHTWEQDVAWIDAMVEAGVIARAK